MCMKANIVTVWWAQKLFIFVSIVQRQQLRSTTAPPNVATTSHWPKRPKTPESVQSEDFPSLGSRNRKPDASLKRPNRRVIEDPWNTSSSSSENPWHQRQSDSDEAPSFVGCEY